MTLPIGMTSGKFHGDTTPTTPRGTKRTSLARCFMR